MGRKRALAAVVIVLASGLVRAEGDAMYEPSFREGKPADELVHADEATGAPALLRGDLDAFVDMTQAAFDVAVPAEKEQALRDALELGFGGAGKDKRQAFLDVVRPVTAIREKARQGDKDGVREGFEAFRRSIDRRLQDLPRSTASRLLGELLGRRHETAWKGEPEIHGGAADAYLELAAFLASLGRNETVAPTSGQLDALRRDLDGALRGKPAEVRSRIGRAHRTWLYVKARWLAADDAKRFAMRWEAVRLAARALPPDTKHQVHQGETLADYAREASNVASKAEAYDVLSNLARNPEPLFEALEKGLGVPKAVPDDILTYP